MAEIGIGVAIAALGGVAAEVGLRVLDWFWKRPEREPDQEEELQ